jgi:hypothetical protein
MLKSAVIGMMETRCTGSACSTASTTRVWPLSRYATRCFSSGLMTCFFFHPQHHAVNGLFKIWHVDCIFPVPGSQQCGFVYDRSRVGSDHPGPSSGYCSQVHSAPILIFCAWTFRIASRPSTPGRSKITWRSNRPPRSRAGANTSGVLVAAIMIIIIHRLTLLRRREIARSLLPIHLA